MSRHRAPRPRSRRPLGLAAIAGVAAAATSVAVLAGSGDDLIVESGQTRAPSEPRSASAQSPITAVAEEAPTANPVQQLAEPAPPAESAVSPTPSRGALAAAAVTNPTPSPSPTAGIGEALGPYWWEPKPIASPGSPAPSASPTNEPAFSGITCEQAKAVRPYSLDSPWNTPIGDNPKLLPRSGEFIKHLGENTKPVTSDISQYTIAVYCADATTERGSVQLAGFFSDYTSGKREGAGYAPRIEDVPLPKEVQAPDGSDGQVVVIDVENGVEYGWWQFKKRSGRMTATNGYVTNLEGDGLFPDGLAGRGAGLTYLGGLVRQVELDAGHVHHALAFAYKWPSKDFVYPASKSDGLGHKKNLPEGARLQLNPELTEAQLRRYGVTDRAMPMAKALQQYGMYVVDNSGSPKVYVESGLTARWSGDVERDMLGEIPWSEFRVVAPPSDW